MKTLWRTCVAVFAALLTEWACDAATNARPNVLWLIAEDFGPQLSCYGTKEVWTPNIDRLAASGVRYDRFFCTAPVCSASRSALMTGMYQTTIGAHNHRSHRDDGYQLPAGVRVLTDRLRDAGYFTANIRELPKPIGFRGTGKTDWNFSYEGKPFDSDKWSELKARQPFYAQVNFSETHRAFHGSSRANPDKVEIPPYEPDHPTTRKDWAAYLDSASELDRKVGVILRQLEVDGLADNTVVVFFGDNGMAHVRGKQFCYDEGLHVPLVIRWPKSIPAPKQFQAGTTNGQIIESIDLTATTLSMAGVPQPAGMQGKPFLGEHAAAPRSYAFGARDRCDETVFRIRTARDVQYRYIRNFTPDRPFLQRNAYKERQYPTWNLLKELHAEGKLTPVQEILCKPNMPAEELYDVTTDRWQVRNLAESPDHRPVLERMRKALDEWITTTDDKGRSLEPAEVVARQGATKNPKAESPKSE